MIAAAKNCGCYDDKSDFTHQKISKTFSLISSENSIQDLEKCVCPKPSEKGYKKLKGTCDICCKGNKSKNECTEDLIDEKRSKVFSEIVEKGLPYKETEVIINDNRMIIRVQKDSKTNEEWDPPCECNEENKKTHSKVENIDNTKNNIIFRKVDLNPCRTITVYPQADSDVHTESNVIKSNNEIQNKRVMKEKMEIERQKREAILKSLDNEENPNIFHLRIKKQCENDEGKYNIDLEFKTPRPWLTKQIVEKSLPLPQSIVSNVTIESEEEGKKKKEETGKKAKIKKGGKKKHMHLVGERLSRLYCAFKVVPQQLA
ncbi:uncharacterized protein LOC127279640 [Leptopilina boulardi]|uniref:uncharacterized protein LOC127279640 n=1 Tax=Leptopilina boulardi TaxID=63433 RepID=UPI0021F5752D|nr:uncharacterized protein LOC127279640 [Leptopilina boulardi]